MAQSKIEVNAVQGSNFDANMRIVDRVRTIAAAYGATPAQVALAWVVRQPGIIAIPKASHPDHVLENRAALELHLTDEDLAWLELAFPPPEGPQPLEII